MSRPTLDELLVVAEVRSPGCARCGGFSECELYGHAICYPCGSLVWKRLAEVKPVDDRPAYEICEQVFNEWLAKETERR